MHVHGLTWLQLDAVLAADPAGRIVLPLGCTEQHAHLSLGTDTIEVERIAVEAAGPLGIPVLPALPYGVTPQLEAFPGSPSVGAATYAALLCDLLGSLALQGFRTVLLLNGHLGNIVARPAVAAWAAEAAPTAPAPARARPSVVWHDWWDVPGVLDLMGGGIGGHASWVESFPWVRVPGVELPAGEKPAVPLDELAPVEPAVARALLGDGSYGGAYDLGPVRAVAVHEAAVAGARAALAAL